MSEMAVNRSSGNLVFKNCLGPPPIRPWLSHWSPCGPFPGYATAQILMRYQVIIGSVQKVLQRFCIALKCSNVKLIRLGTLQGIASRENSLFIIGRRKDLQQQQIINALIEFAI